MNKKEIKDFPYYTFQHFSACSEILHFVSSGARNIGFADEESPEIIRDNRRVLATGVGFNHDDLVMGRQIHSANVALVTKEDAGRGAMDRDSRLSETDALVTDQKGICLMVLSADCVPVLLYDPVKKIIAAIHAGWRGTAAKIVAKTVGVMVERFDCAPGDMLAGIGPSIGPCCFEVGADVADVFVNLFPESGGFIEEGKMPGKYQVDLWAVNRRVMVEAGLKDENIEVAGMCSVCHPDHFFSYRRDGQKAGRFGAGIMLRSHGK